MTMTIKQLRELVAEWDLEVSEDEEEPGDVNHYSVILSQLEFFAKGEWSRYLPSEHPDSQPDLIKRLAQWIANVEAPADQKLLLEYAAHLCFFGQNDFWVLYRSAFSGAITRWIIDKERLGMDDPNFQKSLSHALYHQTWYCAVTDSMDINEFYHANHICSIKHRPAFATLSMIDRHDRKTERPSERLVNNLSDYIARPNPALDAPPLTRLVLLEDFVGSGTQASNALLFALQTLTIPILFVPLVICEAGRDKLSDIVRASAGALEMRPVLTVRNEELIGPNRSGDCSWHLAPSLEELAVRTFDAVAGGV